MEIFLKKYSTVPNDFIEDFFGISKETYLDTDFVIDFEIVIKWLNVRKDNLKLVLTKHFELGMDYTLKTIKQNNSVRSGANYVEKIMLTPDCFKELCMISQTAKAKEVRHFYLSIEKLIRKYHQYIEEKLTKKINLLEKNQKPKVNIKGGVIYFFRALNDVDLSDVNLDDVDMELFKIGKTVNAKNRFNTYNSGNANDVEPLFIIEVSDIHKVEACIKSLLKDFQYRERKEVYKLDVTTLKEVFGKCDELVHGFKRFIENNKDKNVDAKFKALRQSAKGIIMRFQENRSIPLKNKRV
jgi:phage anti-repressor protein